MVCPARAAEPLQVHHRERLLQGAGVLVYDACPGALRDSQSWAAAGGRPRAWLKKKGPGCPRSWSLTASRAAGAAAKAEPWRRGETLGRSPDICSPRSSSRSEGRAQAGHPTLGRGMGAALRRHLLPRYASTWTKGKPEMALDSLCGVRTLWLRPGVPWSSPVHAEQAGAQWGHVVCSRLRDLFGKSRGWLARPSQVSGQARDAVSLQGLISPPHEVMEAGSLRQAHDLASQKLQSSVLCLS